MFGGEFEAEKNPLDSTYRHQMQISINRR